MNTGSLKRDLNIISELKLHVRGFVSLYDMYTVHERPTMQQAVQVYARARVCVCARAFVCVRCVCVYVGASACVRERARMCIKWGGQEVCAVSTVISVV